jgi:hypothetical protein
LVVLKRSEAGHSAAVLRDDDLPTFFYVVEKIGQVLPRFAYTGSSHRRIVPHVALIRRNDDFGHIDEDFGHVDEDLGPIEEAEDGWSCPP